MRRRSEGGIVLAAALLAGVSGGAPDDGILGAHNYYVSPAGDSGARGTQADPWDLSTGLSGASGQLQPGDTVWLRGGTYRGAFRTALKGAPERWIVFRQYPGERATIDGTLRADGAYLAFWGFEIMQSAPHTYGLEANTDHGRFINLVIHDAGKQGVTFWTPGVDAELYGCIIYDNGMHENHDHGVYVHNENGTKLLADNVFFNNFARGIQVYASHNNPLIRNVRVEGNISFNNGSISRAVSARHNLIFDAQVPIEGMVATGNLLYFSGPDGINLSVGGTPGHNLDITLKDNYVVGGRVGLLISEPWRRASISGNILIGSHDLVQMAGTGLSERYQWSGNTWMATPDARVWGYEKRVYDWGGWRRATGLGQTDRVVPGLPIQPRVFVRPNRYEHGRAHIAVFNWGRAVTVPVDLGQVLRPGDRYEIHNVQALFGPPVVSGVYEGEPIRVPMNGVDPPAPLGRTTGTPPRTAPDFDAFLLTSPVR